MRAVAAATLLASASGVSAQLNTLAKAAGLQYFGTELDPGDQSDSTYWRIAQNSSNFGQMTCDNSMKWDAIEPSQGQFNYGTADQQVAAAQAAGQVIRCHNLNWYSQLPSWVSNGNWNAQSMTSVIQSHISNEAGHFKGKCLHWDVVNEALNDDGTYRNDVFYQKLGDSYFAVAFKAAAAADPAAKLYYNDYNLETLTAKAAGARKIVQLIQAAGARIDGVGFQGHMIVGQTPTQDQMASVMASFTALNVDVAFTELDIRTNTPASSSALAQQGVDYNSMVGACLATPRCVGVTVWGFSDAHSWVPNTFSGQGQACLYNSQNQPKPAFTSVSNLLVSWAGKHTYYTGSATPAATTTTTTSTTTSRTALAVVSTSTVTVTGVTTQYTTKTVSSCSAPASSASSQVCSAATVTVTVPASTVTVTAAAGSGASNTAFTVSAPALTLSA